MCGFAGIYSPNRLLVADEISIAERVSVRQAHRGPDTFGHLIGPNIALFHNKLSITTKNSDSNQPFCWEDIQCAFAGEIYNHNVLARQLGVVDGLFDGRVIPIGLARMGLSFLGQLEGEFALVITDVNKKEITLARDSAGARNLYFCKINNDCWLFSTELSAITKDTAVILNPNDWAILGQLLLQEWTPRLDTYFENIYQVPPGTAVTLGNGSIQVEPYNLDFEGMINRADILASTIKNRLEHSYTINGCLAFSGGLDSTAIAAISSGSLTAMPTFTVVSSLEDPIAKRVLHLAEKMPWLQPNMVLLRNDEISDDRLTDLTIKLSSPVCDTTPFALSALFQKASNLGFRYCLSGEGADDLWSGYLFEAPFLCKDSLILAYQSLIDRVLENCFIKYSHGRMHKVPLINREVASNFIQYLKNIPDLGNVAKIQSPLAFDRPLTALSILGPLRRSLEQIDCLAGLYSMEARVPFCSAQLMSLHWRAEWSEGKQWVYDELPSQIKTELDWTKTSFATRHFNDTSLGRNLDILIEEVLATKAITSHLDPAVDASILRMLASNNSKLWWSMLGIARFCSVYFKS